MVPKDFIVAIELGSSKMTGIAGKKNLDGSIQVLACVKEDSSSFIRKGGSVPDQYRQSSGETTEDYHHAGLCRRWWTVYPLYSQCYHQRLTQ